MQTGRGTRLLSTYVYEYGSRPRSQAGFIRATRASVRSRIFPDTTFSPRFWERIGFVLYAIGAIERTRLDLRRIADVVFPFTYAISYETGRRPRNKAGERERETRAKAREGGKKEEERNENTRGAFRVSPKPIYRDD